MPGPAPSTSAWLAGLLPAGPATDAAARWCDRLALLLFVALAALALWIFGDYGVTWDEPPHLTYGNLIGRYYLSGLQDTAALEFRTNYYYGGGYDAFGALFRWLAAPMSNTRAIHMLGGLVGVLGVIGTWRLARRLAGPFAGLVAALLLATNPVYFGHMFNNPKDLPFAVAYVWALDALIAVIAALPRPRRGQWLALTFAFGAAMSVRIAGVLLLCYLGLALALYAAHQGKMRRSLDAALAYLARLGTRGLGVAAGAWALMLLTWPWALQDPLRRPFVTLTHMSSYSLHRRKMPFGGEDILNTEIGWDYLPTYFGYQLPELVLLAGLLGSAVAVFGLLRHGHQHRHLSPALALLTLGLATWLPPIYAIVKDSVLYDGYRHFLFVVPPLTVIAALAIELAATRLRARLRAGRIIVAAVVAACSLDLVLTMHRLHPHEYIYFNRLIGGLGGAQGNYDTDYYGNTFKEALTGLQRWLWRNDPDGYLDTVYSFRGCISSPTARHYLPPNIRRHQRKLFGTSADFHVGYTRGHCDQKHPDAPVIVAVEREGARLNVVKDLRERAPR
ncbi:MAG: glycosyltransferase family 39 protein [Nannocystis sp.]|nr:glycosyltransferase family 39 protein [Nannocystis sp.]MBA3550565.1 glycosyltransferase family 39 protein [Nannocystis sp.]